MENIIIYLLFMTTVTFFAFVADKHFAKNDMWRIPESVLLVFAAAGGSAGALLGMYSVRHKTRKPKFKYGVPILLVIQILVIGMIII